MDTIIRDTIKDTYSFQQETAGASMLGRTITATLFVSPNGDGTDGLTWATAYTTIQDALDAASTDASDLTLIEIAPLTGASNYNINTTGDPTWSANVILKGSHRNWVKIKNEHASATSILKLTGLAALEDLNLNLGSGSGDGVILTKGGFRVDNCMFVSEDLTGAATALHIDGASQIQHGKIRQCDFKGNTTHTTGILLDHAACCEVVDCRIGFSAVGIQIVESDSDYNKFHRLDVCSCTIGFDIDAGNNQQLDHVYFLGCATNIDDEVGDHTYTNIFGQFPSTIAPDDFTGVTVAAGGAANTWTAAPVQVRAAGTKPFRILGMDVEANANEKFRVRLTNGTTYFRDIQLEGVANANKRTTANKPSGTEYIFNTGTVISAETKSESGSNNAVVWLEIQEI